MSLDFLQMLEKEVTRLQSEIPNSDVMANISDLANRQIQLEDLKAKLAELGEKINDAHREVSEKMLPEALASAGVREFKLNDGAVVSVKKNYFPSIEDTNKTVAYNWLVQNGHDIIKNEVSVKLPKGKTEEAQEISNALRQMGFTPEQKETIHWQTFRAWAKEAMEKGFNPPECIKIHIVDKSTVKLPKK